jgi:hypothetical protein
VGAVSYIIHQLCQQETFEKRGGSNSAATPPTPAGIFPPEKLAGWRVLPSVVSSLLVDPNNKTETIIDGSGLKPLTSRCNMVPASA